MLPQLKRLLFSPKLESFRKKAIPILKRFYLYNAALSLLSYKTNSGHIRELNANVRQIRDISDKNYQETLNVLYRIHPVQKEHNLILETETPVALDSLDHIMPSGTMRDNTCKPRFVKACEKFKGEACSYLDLGCAGGGLVRNFLESGHFSIGVEGSNYSFLEGRAEWARIPRHLFTADITKPFSIKDARTAEPQLFDIVGAWEVMEHLPEESLPAFCRNVISHLSPGGVFIASVAMFPLPHHICLHEEKWWVEMFAEHGLYRIAHRNDFVPGDFPRGENDWPPEMGFHIVCKRSPTS
jgi:SAM-dependent methyltransferase